MKIFFGPSFEPKILDIEYPCYEETQKFLNIDFIILTR